MYVYSHAVTKDNIKEFHAELNQKLGELKEFLRSYNLDIGHTHLTYGDTGIDIKIDTFYALSNGSKPWEETNFREALKDLVQYQLNNGTDEEKKAAQAFLDQIPTGNLIGKHVHIPGSSKRYPNETFTVTGFEDRTRYPLKVKRDRDGKDYSWELFKGITFVS